MRGEFEMWECRTNLRPTTRQQRSLLLDRLERDHDLTTVTSDDLERWLDSLHLSPRTRATYVAQLRCFFRWAHREGFLPADIGLRLERPKLPTLLPRPVSEPDLLRALEGASGRVRAWIVLAAYAGFRVGEIAHQRGEDVWDDRIVVTEGKGGHQRSVPMHPVVAREAADWPKAGVLWPLHPSTISGVVSAHLDACGVDATAHMLRHRFATRVYQTTGDLLVTQRLLGHTSLTTTAGYALVSTDIAARAVCGI